MLVYNSVSHDGRVQKEAGSLSRAGYELTVLGLADDRDARPMNELKDGVTVRRLGGEFGRRFKILTLVVVLGLSAGLLVLFRFHPLQYLIAVGCVVALLAAVLFKRSLARIVNGALRLCGWGWEGRVTKELRQIRPSVVHCHDVHTLAVGCRYRRVAGCRLVFDSHELPEHQSMLPGWRRRYNGRRLSP